MADVTIPTTEELWRIIQEERGQRTQLQQELAQLRAQLDHRQPRVKPRIQGTPQAPQEQDRKLSRAKLLGAAGLAGVAGVALAGSQATSAFAQTPPPIPSFTAFASPARVMQLAMNNGDTSPAISALTTISNTASGVPAGAQAAWAAVQSYDSGVLTLYPDGAGDPGIANWAQTGVSNALKILYMLVPLSSAGAFRVHAYFTTTIYVDVWGYLY